MPERRKPFTRVATLREERRRRVLALAAEQDGMVARKQIYALGITRPEVKANIRASRWQRVFSQSIYVHTGPIPDAAMAWAGVFEAGPRAFLDGDSALIAEGLTNYTARSIRISVPRGAAVRRAAGLNIRQTRRWAADDVTSASGVPRAKLPVAAIRGALWAKSNRQAALLLTMSVQQRMVRVEDLVTELMRVRRDRRRIHITDVLTDLADGARSLGELDFARECRRRGLPRPSRQCVRRGRYGRYYLDVCWEKYGVVVEIDGVQHTWAQAQVHDALRQNDVTLEGDTVLRLPVLGLRVAPDAFFAQIVSALRAGGCELPDSVA